MRGVNKVIIIGNLGSDPETRQFNNGGTVTNISVATTEQWTDKQSGEKKEATEWHRISFSGRTAEVANQYLRKGSKVYIEGKLQTRKYEKNGQDHYVTEIKAFSMQMLDSQNEGQQPNNQQSSNNQQTNNYSRQPEPQQTQRQAPTQNPAMNGGGVVDDDIPFTKHFDGQL